MLTITGAASRAFTFPAALDTALAYYFDLQRIVAYLPHISLITAYANNHVSLMYRSEELQAYTISIYCDLQARLEDGSNGRSLLVRPVQPANPVASEASLASTQGQGLFAIDAHFSDAGNGRTHIEYTLQMQAKLPRPRGMRLMPRRIVNRLAEQITQGRITEIADGFVQQTLAEFPDWLTSNQPA